MINVGKTASVLDDPDAMTLVGEYSQDITRCTPGRRALTTEPIYHWTQQWHYNTSIRSSRMRLQQNPDAGTYRTLELIQTHRANICIKNQVCTYMCEGLRVRDYRWVWQGSQCAVTSSGSVNHFHMWWRCRTKSSSKRPNRLDVVRITSKPQLTAI